MSVEKDPLSVQSAIVLAAGEGQRLRPLTDHRPKPMLPAGTKPILEHVFNELIDAGINELTVVVGYGRTAVQSHFGSSYRDVPIEYIVQETRLGSGHALQVAASSVNETTLVVNGDQLVDSSIIADTIDTHTSGAAATIGVVSGSVADYGGVIVDADGDVEAITENPTGDRPYQLNAGVYALEPHAVETMTTLEPTDGEVSLVDGLSMLLENTETVAAAATDGTWIDATYPWDLLEIVETLFDTEQIENKIAPSAQVHETATIVEPAIVTSNCVIGPGAVVGPHVCLRENVTVGTNATITRSVIDADSCVGDNATVQDCVTGREVGIGPSSMIVGGPGDVSVETTIYRNEQLGALIADRTTDGGGVTYAPGSVVGSNVTIRAGTTVTGTIDSDAEFK